MAAGVERMNRQDLRQRRHSGGILAVDSFGQVSGGKRHPQSALTSARMNLTVDGEPVLTTLHQPARLPCSKRTTAPEQEDPLEDAGLTCAVGAENEVPPSI